MQANENETAAQETKKEKIPEGPKRGSGGNPLMAVTGESGSDQCDMAEIE